MFSSWRTPTGCSSPARVPVEKHQIPYCLKKQQLHLLALHFWVLWLSNIPFCIASAGAGPIYARKATKKIWWNLKKRCKLSLIALNLNSKSNLRRPKNCRESGILQRNERIFSSIFSLIADFYYSLPLFLLQLFLYVCNAWSLILSSLSYAFQFLLWIWEFFDIVCNNSSTNGLTKGIVYFYIFPS